MDWKTSTSLLSRLRRPKSGSQWQKLDRRFRRPITNYAEKMGLDPESAEDATQNTLLHVLKLYLKGRYDRTKGHLNRWIFGIAHRQILSQRASDARASIQIGLSPSCWDSLPNPSSEDGCISFSSKQIEDKLNSVRKIVNDRTYRIFEKVALQGASPSEVAREEKISVQAVYDAKHRVLSRLRQPQAK